MFEWLATLNLIRTRYTFLKSTFKEGFGSSWVIILGSCGDIKGIIIGNDPSSHSALIDLGVINENDL